MAFKNNKTKKSRTGSKTSCVVLISTKPISVIVLLGNFTFPGMSRIKLTCPFKFDLDPELYSGCSVVVLYKGLGFLQQGEMICH